MRILHSYRRSDDFRGGGNGVHDDDDDDVSFFDVCVCDYDGLAEELDLLIITGGRNEDIRVITETEIATSMVSMGKPVLGICHGAFLLTHILGGQVDGDKEQHFFSEHTNYYDTQGREVTVNSSHTVFIKNKPPGAQILCTDPEGDCESWIKDNICAIVWHPERMESDNNEYPLDKLFAK